MAEFIAADIIAQRGLEKKLSVYSSAVSAEEEGNAVYPRALAKLKAEGVPTYPHYANKLTKESYGKYDLFVGMEDYHLDRMKRIFGGDSEGKVKRLLDYTGEGGNIADPWYTGNFDIAYTQIREGVIALINTLEGTE